MHYELDECVWSRLSARPQNGQQDFRPKAAAAADGPCLRVRFARRYVSSPASENRDMSRVQDDISPSDQRHGPRRALTELSAIASRRLRQATISRRTSRWDQKAFVQVTVESKSRLVRKGPHRQIEAS
jgi:hypothetical protein